MRETDRHTHIHTRTHAHTHTETDRETDQHKHTHTNKLTKFITETHSVLSLRFVFVITILPKNKRI